MLEVKSKSVSKKNSTVSAAVLKKWSVTPEKRYQMIAEAAYFRAEKRGFVMGDAAQDWLEAEAEICGILQEHNIRSGRSEINVELLQVRSIF